MKCDTKHCRQEGEYLVMDKWMCQEHWEKHADEEDKKWKNKQN